MLSTGFQAARLCVPIGMLGSITRSAPRSCRACVSSEALLHDCGLAQVRLLDLAGDGAIAEHDDPIAEMCKILVFHTRNKHGPPGLREIANSSKDLLARAD